MDYAINASCFFFPFGQVKLKKLPAGQQISTLRVVAVHQHLYIRSCMPALMPTTSTTFITRAHTTFDHHLHIRFS